MRYLILAGAMLLTGCVQSTVPVQPVQEEVHISDPVEYKRLCTDVFLRKDERAKVALEADNIPWDTLECRQEAFKELTGTHE